MAQALSGYSGRARTSLMQIQTSNAAEGVILERRFRALAHALGPFVDLAAVLPDGRVLRSPYGGLSPAAQCASLNERLEEQLARQGSCGGNR